MKDNRREIKPYLQKLLDEWNSCEEYGGIEALGFITDIEKLLEYWDERIKN